MLKKISSTLAVTVLAATALTGCSAKLSVADTCSYINDQIKERDIAAQIQQAQEDSSSAGLSASAKPIKALGELMADAAKKTEDDKLAEALNATAEQHSKTAEILSEKDVNVMTLSDKLNQAVDMDAMDEYGEYLDQTCPDVDALDN